MSRLEVGQTFKFEGSEFCVKRVDYTGQDPLNKSGEPRIDASEFVTDEEGETKLKKGRPKRFDIEEVHSALGFELPEEYLELKSTSKVDEFKASIWTSIEPTEESLDDSQSSSSIDEIEEALSDPDSW